MRSDSLAQKLGDKNVRDFWNEVKLLNNCRSPFPSNTEGVVGKDRIAIYEKITTLNFLIV